MKRTYTHPPLHTRHAQHGEHIETKQVFEGRSFGGATGKDTIRIFPLGGAGNVTKNMYLYEYRYDGKLRDILIVDCGIGFPDEEMFGVDLVIPDVRYLMDKGTKSERLYLPMVMMIISGAPVYLSKWPACHA